MLFCAFNSFVLQHFTEAEIRSKGMCRNIYPLFSLLSMFFFSLSLHREYALASIKNGEKDIMVATDVAGRGIDIR